MRWLKSLLATAALVAAFSCLSACRSSAQSNAPTTNLSLTITTGNAFQAVPGLPAGTSRRSLTIENNNITSDNCWLFLGPTANATKNNSILIGPGGSYQRYYPYVPNDNVAVTCATTGDTLYVDTQ